MSSKSKHWTKSQIKLHEKAARKLSLIKDEVFEFIKENKNVFEEDVRQFIKKRYRAHGLKNDDAKEFAIVAFGKNTSFVHYFPKKRGERLKSNSLILLDIWARVDKKSAPYADMTWMFFFGNKIPKDIQKKWKILAKARNASIYLIVKKIKNKTMPIGKEIDDAAHSVLGFAGFGENIKHTVGHSLGFDHPHGKLPGINWKEYSPIKKSVGYTIEPGMYFADKFGLRTEIDFYISAENKVVITTEIQKDIDIF